MICVMCPLRGVYLKISLVGLRSFDYVHVNCCKKYLGYFTSKGHHYIGILFVRDTLRRFLIEVMHRHVWYNLYPGNWMNA